ncbi:LOW QUALITY PROTEIN: doublecortin domain-containing protein 2-like [Cottoperca gobio]|uniref:Doublecortin domain-containing protein 2 n=1 Tax=Cottoperca gobio TaxID=56716 RepID=A0A6J2RCT9_COTGO|nr:LOW QUALITY PROTEIN: doublecortin domain-containing protein 2 [Cottoperca gobio]
MGSEKPNFLSQPVVKNIFMYRNGDPYYDARRIVINQKRVSNFETLLREVTGGIQAPFGAVRNIYTPRGGHKVDCLESLQSGEQYVAAGRERFRRLDYLQIGSRRKRMMQTLPMQAKPLPPNRIIVSARFLKPIKEPCTIFMVANGDVLNPVMRLLVHQRMLAQFDRILEMITEKMGMRVLGGVRSLYTYEGHQVTDGNQLESGQLYVAVGRERFKKLPYSDLLFTKPRGTRRVNGMKAYSLPPIYRFSKQHGNSKSIVRCSDSGGGDSKASPPGHNGSSKDHLSSIVREISQARLMSLRKKRSGQSMTLGISDNGDLESKDDDGNTEDKKTTQDQPADEKLADDDAKAAEDTGEKAGEKEEEEAANTTEEDTSTSNEEMKENQETSGVKEGGQEDEGNAEQNDEKEGEATADSEEEKKKKEEVEEEVEEVTDESKEEVGGEEQGSSSSNSDKTQDSKEIEDGSHTSSEGEREEPDSNTEEDKQDKDSGKGEKSSEDRVNDVDTGEEQKETENSSDPGNTRSDNETKENDNGRGSSSSGNQDEDVGETKEGATKESGEEEREVNGEVSRVDDEVESGAEPDMDENSAKDAAANGEKGVGDDEDSQDESRKEKD